VIAVLVPRWLAALEEKVAKAKLKGGGTLPPKKSLYLISGAGSTGAVDTSASANSTEGTATLIARFQRACSSDMMVSHVASGVDVFRRVLAQFIFAAVVPSFHKLMQI
jgi:hypothetical protein